MMPEPAAPSLADLIEQITTWPFGMPVRPMERVLAVGESAVPALAEALARWQDDEERDPLWLVVLLGESRASAAVEPLIGQLRRPDLDLLAQAAGEALAKIGRPALPALLELTRTGDRLQRLHAYTTLGWIADDRAYAALVEALSRDQELGDVLAMALTAQGRPEAIPFLYEAYQRCEPWQRIEFEDAIRELRWNRHDTPLWTRDWRLRYRRLPALGGGIGPEWVTLSALAHQDSELRQRRVTLPVRSLEEIVGDRPEPDEPAERCEECGTPVERPTGVSVCPETALEVALYQNRFLGEARDEDGIEDLFDLLDELEEHEWEHLDRDEPVTPAARERWREERDELRLCCETCEWLIEQGVEEVGPAKALLLAKAAWLADRYGDPEGLLRPVRPPSAGGPKVGRNDPCPCGSGLKYKRCCLGKA